MISPPEPAVTETDHEDKYCVRRIIDFYKRHQLDYADYFLAAWRYERRAALGEPNASLRDIAMEAGLSEKYLAAVERVLQRELAGRRSAGPASGALWRITLPVDVREQDAARRDCERMRDLVLQLRKRYEPKVGEMRARGISPGSQPFVLWRARRLATGRMRAPGEIAARDVQEFCRIFPDAFVVSDRPPYFDLKGGAQGRPLSAGDFT